MSKFEIHVELETPLGVGPMLGFTAPSVICDDDQTVFIVTSHAETFLEAMERLRAYTDACPVTCVREKIEEIRHDWRRGSPADRPAQGSDR